MSNLAVKFDTLTYSQNLQNAGCEKTLADVHAYQQAEVIFMIINEHMVTKEDILRLEQKLTGNGNKLQLEFKEDISNLRQEVKEDIHKLEVSTKIEMGEIRREITALDGKTQLSIAQLNQTIISQNTGLLIKLSAIMAAIVGLFDFMHKFRLL